MTTLYEKELKTRISPETYKNAAAMAESGSVIFCYGSDGGRTVVVKGQDRELSYLKVKDIFAKLDSQAGSFSIGEAAALIFMEQFRDICGAGLRIPDRFMTRQSLKTKKNGAAQEPSRNRLILNSKKGLPNTTSVWERLCLSVRVVSGKKELIGNVNKLNQIRNENDPAHDGIVTFSPQARQVIRFLTQYAEPDGADFSLKSDVLSDLFHCLTGYEDFYCGPGRITIHPEPAGITAIYSDEKKEFIKPALLIDGSIIPLANHQIVAGRSGIWIGMNSEYRWLPATIDFIWLRNFILSDKPLACPHPMPLEIHEDRPSAVLKNDCLPVYFIDYADNQLSAELYFDYGAARFGISENLAEHVDDNVIFRDKNEEKRLENGLYEMGFRLSPGSPGRMFRLEDSEAISLYIENVLPELRRKCTGRLFFTEAAAGIASSDISSLKLICRSYTETDCQFNLSYIIAPRANSTSSVMTWKQLQAAAREHRRFVIQDSRIYRIPEELAVFTRKMKGTAVQDKASHYIICLPKGAQLFWIDKAQDIPSAVPDEWLNAKQDLSEKFAADAPCDLSADEGFSGTLREYQKKAVSWMDRMITKGLNVILADEMGLGKTVQALALINLYFRTDKSPGTCLVVCPTSLVENWESEAMKFTPGLKVQAIKGVNRAMQINNLENCKIAITSYALIKRDFEFYENTEFGIVILDEAQHIKNPVTINAKVCKSLKSRHRLVLTGTPLENSPEDVWSIFDFLNPGMLGGTETFKVQYSGIENDRAMQDELAARIAPFILRRHKKDVEDLPEKTAQTLYCTLTDAQQKIYDRILEEGRSQFRFFHAGKSTRFDVLSSLLRLRQLCCHPGLLPPDLQNGIQYSAKCELLKEIVFEAIDSGHRTLIFSQFTTLLAIIRKWCDEEKILYEYLDGSTKNRLDRVNNFNSSPDIPLFLLSLKAGGTGLNLTGADTVIIYDPWWNPSVEMQATDRTHRIGQDKPVTTIKLVVKDSIEEKILNLQTKKQGMFNRIIENNSSFSRLTTDDLEYLLN